jgi:AcrR family transcriptional regulator
MVNRKKPRATTYQAHRDRQRRRILDAAAKLFDERELIV